MSLMRSRFHFIGIGGIGMSALAELLHNMGAEVAGSDMQEGKQTDYLKKIGIQVHIGHNSENIRDCDVVVYSSAVNDLNPEMKQAKKQSIPRIRRAEALAEIMRLKRGIAVGGTHGKTTTTSLLATIMIHAGKEPTIAVGGRLDLIKSAAKLGKGEWIVAEADESDGSFSLLNPEISIITNIDNDHMEYYKNMENLRLAFFEFANRTPFYGSAIVFGDDPDIRESFESFPKKILFYGFDKFNDFVIKKEADAYSLNQGDICLGKFDLILPGKHNILNATAASIAAHLAGVTWDNIFSGISSFSGVDRRFEKKGERSKVVVFDDYGHHPTEVQATLAACKEKYPQKRIVVLFQPHRYSRTKSCWSEFMQSFKDCDQLYVTDVYSAGEVPIGGIDAVKFSEGVRGTSSQYVGGLVDAQDKVFPNLKAGDLFLTLGAGNVWQAGEAFLQTT